MADFSQLTPAQQKAIRDFSAALRGSIGELARVLDRLRALNANYNSTISAILAMLTGMDADVAIDDGTQLAGAMPLSPNEMITLVSHLQAELAIFDDAHLFAWVKAGPTNVVG